LEACKAVDLKREMLNALLKHQNYHSQTEIWHNLWKTYILLLARTCQTSKFSATASVLASSASRALGGICSKFKNVNGFGFPTLTALFDAGVSPILDYASGIWGYQSYTQIDAVQNKAIRFYLGVHRFATNNAINGDVGWVPTGIRRKINMLRFWNRMIKCHDDRLTKRIFAWDIQRRRHSGSWSSDISKVFSEIGSENSFDNLLSVNLGVAKRKLCENFSSKWKNEICNTPKLRTYCTYKSHFEAEPYIFKIHNRKERSILSQFRCGILPLKAETGRYTQIPLELRHCLLCDTSSIEDESHFFFDCTYYNDLRQNFIQKVSEVYPYFVQLSNTEKLKLCMNHSLIKITAKFLCDCYSKRQIALFN